MTRSLSPLFRRHLTSGDIPVLVIPSCARQREYNIPPLPRASPFLPIFRHFFFFLFPFSFFLFFFVSFHARCQDPRASVILSSLSPSLSLWVPLFFFEALRCGEGKFTREEGGARARIYIYLYVCLLRACVYVRVRVYSKRDEAESGGTGGESCALN